MEYDSFQDIEKYVQEKGFECKAWQEDLKLLILISKDGLGKNSLLTTAY